MTKRTSVFLFVAAGVLVAGLATGLVAWSMGVPVFAALGSNLPDELAYVPDTAHLVAYADVRQVMNSQFRDRLRQYQRNTPSNPDGLEARTGINLETDIDRVVAAMSARTGDVRTDRPLMIARGRFNEVKIEGLMREQGAQVEQYRGKRLVFIRDDAHDAALAFVETGLVLFGDGAAVRRAIDTKAGAGANITGNKEFMSLLGEVDEGTAWTVGKFDALTGRTPLPPDVASQLPPIDWLAASGRVDGDVHGLIRAEARDDEAAKNLRDVVRGFLALVKIQGSRTPELKGLLDSIELGGEGKSVSLSFDVTPEVIDSLGSGALGRRPAVPRRPARPEGNPQVF
jgi:hypothetical protein